MTVAKRLNTLSNVAKFLMISAFLGLHACEDDSERYEAVTKLRTFGASASPIIGQPSTADSPQSATFTIYAAVPLGATVSAEPFLDEKTASGLQLPVTLVTGSEAYIEHAAFRIYSIQAQATLPSTETMPIPTDPGFLRLRYGVRLISGTEEEKVVGTFLVYPREAPEQDWATKQPSVAFATPTSEAVIGTKTDLKATIDNPIGETMRIAWFVPSGKVKNRRAKETEWDEASAGTQTIIFTARGRQSGAFAWQAIDVTVQ